MIFPWLNSDSEPRGISWLFQVSSTTVTLPATRCGRRRAPRVVSNGSCPTGLLDGFGVTRKRCFWQICRKSFLQTAGLNWWSWLNALSLCLFVLVVPAEADMRMFTLYTWKEDDDMCHCPGFMSDFQIQMRWIIALLWQMWTSGIV